MCIKDALEHFGFRVTRQRSALLCFLRGLGVFLAGKSYATGSLWEVEEEVADLKMNSTLFVPEQSISGGAIREGGREA